MHPALRVVTERFPRVGGRVALLFERDEAFRDLCEEYQTCADAAARLRSDGRSVEAVRKEYAALVLRLEGELLRYLGEHPGGG